MTGLSKSVRSRQSQFNDLRTRGYSVNDAWAEVDRTDEAIDRSRAAERTTVATGVVAAHLDQANAVIIYLDSPAVPKFQAGERVTVRSGGLP